MPARLLLVHSPLTGPQTWDMIAPHLAEPGWPVILPDLTSTIAAGPPYGRRQIKLIARGAGGQPAVLIGHSGAGPLLAAAGAMFEEIHPPAPRWPDAPCAYLQLSDAYEAEAARAADLGWPVARLISYHLAPLTDPAGVAAAVRDLLRQ
jgi:hypothetical protein